MVEEARLESVYTPKGYPGFESPSLRETSKTNDGKAKASPTNSTICGTFLSPYVCPTGHYLALKRGQSENPVGMLKLHS